MKTAILATSLVGLMTFGASANDVAPISPLKNRSIAYVLTHEEYAVTNTADAKECPEGLNIGPREEYKQLYPMDGKARTVAETELAREAAIWFPTLDPEPFPFKFAGGKVAPGMNLDGKVDGPNKFTSPEGEPGIDNQFYRVLGCIVGFRNGYYNYLTNEHSEVYNYARMVIELTNVDNLVNSDDVIVTKWRGLDKMMTDASGQEFLSHGSQRIDPRWGKQFYGRTHGKIVNGVLITEPFDVYWPHSSAFQNFAAFLVKGSRLKLRLTPEDASGLWAGYLDVESWYRQLIGSSSTHTLTASSIAAQSLYKAAYQVADAYPDPKTGRNTAISSARIVRFKQVYVTHPDEKVASENGAPQAAAPSQKTAQNTAR